MKSIAKLRCFSIFKKEVIKNYKTDITILNICKTKPNNNNIKPYCDITKILVSSSFSNDESTLSALYNLLFGTPYFEISNIPIISITMLIILRTMFSLQN